METKELITLCLRRNRAGEKLLYERYITVMARLCQRYIKDNTTVQDLLTEGFIKVFDKLPTFEYRGEQSLEIWIRKIMINECLMLLRKSNKLTGITDEMNEPVQAASIHVEVKEMITLINLLPTGYRTILNLYVIDGYSHKEIATLLGITESASRSQLTHARNKLKEILKTHGWNGMIK